jgi:hypothetical protein
MSATGHKAEVLCMLAQQLLWYPQAAIANGSNERPLMAEMRRSRMARVDPYQSFRLVAAKVRYRIAKRSFEHGGVGGRKGRPSLPPDHSTRRHEYIYSATTRKTAP